MIPKPYNARLRMYEIKSSLTLLHGIIHKAQLKIAGIVGHGVGIPEYFAKYPWHTATF